MQGSIFLLAVIERSEDPEDGWITTVTGSPLLACVTIAEAETKPKFTCILAGHYLCIWTGKTYRENLLVEVISPASAATARNSQEWKKLEFDQIMEAPITLTLDGLGYITGCSVAPVTQNREFMPFDAVSFQWIANLETSDVCELETTPSNEEREWKLLIFRLGNTPPTTFRDNPNRLTATPYVDGGTLTRTLISATDAWIKKYRVVCTAGTNAATGNIIGPTVNFNWRPVFDHLAKARIWRDSVLTSGWPASSVTFRVLKDATSLYSSTFTLPIDESVVEVSFLVVGGTIGVGEVIEVRIEGIDSGDSFEMELSLEVQT